MFCWEHEYPVVETEEKIGFNKYIFNYSQISSILSIKKNMYHICQLIIWITCMLVATYDPQRLANLSLKNQILIIGIQ